MSTADDPIMQTRLDVAEMKGMLSTVITTHDQRLTAHDQRLADHDRRLDDKGKNLARLDERMQDLEDDNSARWGRVTGTLGLVISALVGLLAIFNTLAT